MHLASSPLVRNVGTALGTNNRAHARLPYFRYGTWPVLRTIRAHLGLYAVHLRSIFTRFARLRSAYSADRIIYEDRHPIFVQGAIDFALLFAPLGVVCTSIRL